MGAAPLYRCAALFLLLTFSVAKGLPVYLTNMTVFTKHRLDFEGDLRVYFQCDGQDRVHLPDITIEGHPYAWPAEDLLLTTITKGSCKTCGFFEERLLPFVRDDPFGAPFPLCESDFSGPDSRDSLVRWLAETQFDAIMFCPECNPASPPPVPAEAEAQTGIQTEEDAMDAAGSTGAPAAQAARWWQRTGAIVGMSVSAALVLGLAIGAVAYSMYKRRQVRKEEEREKAFERVFNDPDVDLEEVAAQDAKSAGFLAFGRNAWTRLRDTQVSTEV